MSYLDRTWCKNYKECPKGGECLRALTPKVKTEAEEVDYDFFSILKNLKITEDGCTEFLGQ